MKEGDNPSVQGKLAGKGLGALSSSFTRYRVPEHGIMLALFSIVPKLSYASQGINKNGDVGLDMIFTFRSLLILLNSQ